MSLLANSNAIETGGYQISRSVRLRSSANAYLNRTQSTPTDEKKFTHSAWLKRGRLGVYQAAIGGRDNATAQTPLAFNASDQIVWGESDGVSTYYSATTTAVFRDPSAWYHIVTVYDSNNATAADRLIIYVNGVRQAITISGSGSSIPSGRAGYWNQSGTSVLIGATNTVTDFFDGYLTEVHFIDGQALTPSSFGETDTITGSWVAKKYTGTYGTNGFYLPFNLDSIIFSADYLVVAGGGGGGYGGGGGGAGGLLTGNTNLEVNVPYAVKVGAGGNGSTSAGVGGNIGNLGNESKFSTFIGGGGGAGGSSNNGVYNVNITPGSGAYALNGNGAGGAYTASSAGGSGSNAGYSGGAGNGSVSGSGGGSGGNGSTGGAGGAGTISSITGSSVTYATGGGSSGSASGGANTGNGGGGGGSGANSGGNGGSGVVIIKIPNTRTATFSSGVSSSLSTAVSGYKIYTVTATSTTSETVIFS